MYTTFYLNRIHNSGWLFIVHKQFLLPSVQNAWHYLMFLKTEDILDFCPQGVYTMWKDTEAVIELHKAPPLERSLIQGYVAARTIILYVADGRTERLSDLSKVTWLSTWRSGV